MNIGGAVLGPRWKTAPPARDESIAQLRERWPGLPEQYMAFLRHTNGAWLDGLYQLWPAEEVLADGYNAAEYGPHLVFIGTPFTGCLYAFDLRDRDTKHVWYVDSISDWEKDGWNIARDFEHFLRRLERISAEGKAMLERDEATD
jgi:hypothetical protein